MTKKLILMAIIILSSTLNAQTDLGYVELNTTNMNQLEEQITWLNSSGLSVIHIFPPNAVFVRAGNIELETDFKNSAIVNFIPPANSPSTKSNLSSPLNQTAYKAWLHLSLPDLQKDDPSHASSPLTNCVKRLDDSIWAKIPMDNRVPHSTGGLELKYRPRTWYLTKAQRLVGISHFVCEFPIYD